MNETKNIFEFEWLRKPPYPALCVVTWPLFILLAIPLTILLFIPAMVIEHLWSLKDRPEVWHNDPMWDRRPQSRMLGGTESGGSGTGLD